MPNTQAETKWHVGKEIPLVLVAAVILQTGFFVIWLSKLAANVDTFGMVLQEFKAERYTREDARRDRELMDQKFMLQAQSALEHVRRTQDLESRTQQMERNTLRR